MELLLTVLVLVPILWCIDGYPTGAHSDACGPMIPRHVGAYPQHTPSPYSVLTNSKMFYPGYPVTVTIAGPQYRGLLLQARSHESNDALGSWQLPPPDTKFLNCSNNPHGAMTHSNPNLKGVTTVYSWVPPDFHGPIYFMVTVVQERTVFWVHLSSIHVFRGSGPPPGPVAGPGRAGAGAGAGAGTGAGRAGALATGGQSGLAEQTSIVALVMSFLLFAILG
ncbi:putative defense protein 3 [Gouania willdenowi]|uniref:putative defense protein 3 n=1 Tax=Gouania willdenowi TaxID=441366 RepID=UPI0010542912|nr:putative defense protein 3 [Gouania willdenowi]